MHALRALALTTAFLLLACLPGRAAAQTGQVTGVVRDANSGQALAGATAELLLAGDSSVVATSLTNPDGRLLFTGLPPARYVVRISTLAYRTLWSDVVALEADALVNLGLLGMSVEALELDALAVTTERSAITFEADRISYDVTAMPSAQGSTASELLRGMPELEVDLDGQVSIRGASTAIYIDGRPAPMNGLSLTAFLEQFPAENIERVEVIDNPSARYSAEDSGGIVNIVLREGVELGLTGIAFLNGGTRGQMGTGVRSTLQRGAWTVDGGLSVSRSDRDATGYDLRQNLIAEPTTFLQQDSRSNRSSLSGNLDLEVRFEPTERSRFWVEGRVNGRDDGSDGFTTTTQMDAARAPTSVWERSTALDAGAASGRFGTGFRYEWERRRHEFEIELDVDRGADDEDTIERLEAFDASDPTVLPADLTEEEERQRDRELRFGVDYVRPLGDSGRIEVGYRLDTDGTDSDRTLRLVEGSAGATPVETALGFRHDQTFNAVYLTVQQGFGPLSVQLGLRGEDADTRFEVPTGEVFENDYRSLFPSASLSARIDDSKQVRLSYSRRIGRPSASILNPIDRSTDPLNRRVGNPYVEPEYTHSLSMDVSVSSPLGRLRLSPYYRRSDGGWAQITLVDSDGVSTRTWDNVSSETRYGASLTAWMRRGSAVSGYVSLDGSRQIQDASNLSADYSSRSFRWRTRANLEAVVTPELSAEGRFTYSPAVDLPQGRSDARWSTDFGFRYRFLERRASLRMSFEDPFGLEGSSFETRDPTHVQIGRSFESNRSVRFSLSYAFGGGGESGRRR